MTMNEEWIWNKEQSSSEEKSSMEEQVDETTTKTSTETSIEDIVAVLNETKDVENQPKENIVEEKEIRPAYYGGSYYRDWKNQQQQKQESETKETLKTEEVDYDSYDWKNELEELKIQRKERGAFRGIGKTIVSAVVFGIVAGFVMFGVNKAANHFWKDEVGTSTQVSNVQLQTGDISKNDNSNTDASNVISGTGYTVAEVAESCMPSVVSITNASVTTVKNYFGGTQEYESKSSGSGIIVGQNETELLIATNNHVIDGAETITIAFCDESVYEAQKKGSASNADLAVVAVRLSDMSKETLEAIRIIQIADAEDIKIGEQVVAIGNALGYGQSVTSGWVSAIDRSVEDEDGNTVDSLIQTDAAINPGNSGGALLNMRGELIGINSAKINSTTVEGMGYAISIGKAEPILNELMNLKTRYKVDASKASYLGITCYNVDSIVTQMYGIPAGAFIDSVVEGGPAAKAGLKKGDVIVKFDGQTVSSSTELVELLEYYAAGEVVEMIAARASEDGYKEVTLTITLGNKNQAQ